MAHRKPPAHEAPPADPPAVASGGLTPVLLNIASAEGFEISAVNISLARAIYTATLMEELRVFAIADRLADLFAEGALPIVSASGDKKFEDYLRDAPLRLGPQERRNLFARVLGSPGAKPRTQGNADFNPRFQAFLKEVLRLASGDSEPPRPSRAQRTAREREACLAAKALAANLSRHGAGVQLQVSQLTRHLQEAVSLLSDPAVRQHYGAESMWQLVEILAHREFGAAPNAVALRALAESGSRILDWLSQNVSRVCACPEHVLLGAGAFAEAGHGGTPGRVSDRALFEACESWLLASACIVLPAPRAKP